MKFIIFTVLLTLCMRAFATDSALPTFDREQLTRVGDEIRQYQAEGRKVVLALGAVRTERNNFKLDASNGFAAPGIIYLDSSAQRWLSIQAYRDQTAEEELKESGGVSNCSIDGDFNDLNCIQSMQTAFGACFDLIVTDTFVRKYMQITDTHLQAFSALLKVGGTMIFDNSETNVLSTEFQLKQKKDWEEEAKKELLYATKYKDLPDTEKKPKWVKYINAEGKLTHSEFDDGYVKYLAFRSNPASNYDECLSDLTTHFSQDTLQAFQIPLEGKGPLPPIDHTCGTREEMLAKWHEDQKTWVQYQDAAPEIKRLAQDFFDRHLSEWRTKAARANLTIQTEFGTFPYWSEGHYNLPKDAKGIYQPMHYLTLTKVA